MCVSKGACFKKRVEKHWQSIFKTFQKRSKSVWKHTRQDAF